MKSFSQYRFSRLRPRAGASLRCFLLTVFVTMNVTSAFAGSYTLTKGKGVEVCEQYMKFLATQKTALNCDRNIPPEFSPLKKPNWQKLDLWENRELILRIEDYLTIPNDYKATKPSSREKNEDSIEYAHKHGTPLYLWSADIDIDNDGRKETVLKYRSHSCQSWDGPKPPLWRAPIVVFDMSKRVIDIEKTHLLMQNEGKHYVSNWDEAKKTGKRLEFSYSKYAPGSSVLQGYDAFIYSNETFFDRWDENKQGKHYETLTVYKTEKHKTAEVCRYQFRW